MESSAMPQNAEGSPPAGPPKTAGLQRFIERTLDSPVALTLLVMACLFPLLVFVVFPLPARAHIVLSLIIVAIALVITARFPKMRLAIVVLSLAASTRYMLFRGTETLAWGSWSDISLSLMLYGAEMYSFVTLMSGYFQTAIIRRNKPVSIEGLAPSQLPSVDIFIPTYNESAEVLRPTVMGALSVDYPRKRVWVLDDGRRSWVQDMCAELGAGYLDRPDNYGAKAGNVNAALPRTNGELIAFFDADHVPVRGFLKATVGFFLQNTNLSLVQTPHHFYNPDPFMRNLHLEGTVPPEQHLFYHGIQLGNDFWNSAFFCGSCAVIRREALEEVGGLCHDTVTEDAHTALQMHSQGWDSLYLDIPLAAGLATETYGVHIGQRVRWARGMAQIVRLDNPLFKPGLTLPQRVNYFNAAWHFFFGLPRMVFLITPAVYLLTDIHPLDANVREVLVYAIPHLILVSLGAVSMHRNVRHSLWPEVYEAAIAPYTALVTSLAIIAPRRGKFNVTAKGSTLDKATFDWRNAMPLLVGLGLIVIAFGMVPVKIQQNPLDLDTILVAALWNGYNLIVLTAATLAALERPQRRRFHRIYRDVTVTVRASDPEDEGWFAPLVGRSGDLSMGGLAMEFKGEHDFPVSATVTIQNPQSRTGALAIEPISVRYDAQRDLTLVRARFGEFTTEGEAQLSAQMFGPTDGWTHETFRFDRYWRSVVSVLVAIVAAAFGNPPWLAKFTRRETAKEEMGELVPGANALVCDSCGVYRLEGSLVCEACGHEHAGEHHEAIAVTTTPSLGGFSPLVLPILLLMLGLALAVGFKPVVDAFSSAVPMQRWEKVTHQTRKGMLGQAYHRIDALADELERNQRLGHPVDIRWERRVWDINRDYRLLDERLVRPETREIEDDLARALDLLEESRTLYHPDGSDDRRAAASLQEARDALDSAALRLKIPH